jgi:hypothetical protein
MNKQPRQLAADPTTDPEILAKLSETVDSDILELVASNPNTPINVLWSLIGKYSHQIVDNPIFSLINLVCDPHPMIRKKLFSNKIRYDRLPELLNHSNPVVRNFALEYSNIQNLNEM